MARARRRTLGLEIPATLGSPPGVEDPSHPGSRGVGDPRYSMAEISQKLRFARLLEATVRHFRVV